MHCPVCSLHGTKVVETRMQKDGHGIRRRRLCPGCGFRFSTLEAELRVRVEILKRSGGVELFTAEKLRRSIETACQKRPIPSEKIERLVKDIENEISSSNEPLLSSQHIGAKVMKALEEIDPVAFVRYTSVHRQAASTQDLVQIIESLN